MLFPKDTHHSGGISENLHFGKAPKLYPFSRVLWAGRGIVQQNGQCYCTPKAPKSRKWPFPKREIGLDGKPTSPPPHKGVPPGVGKKKEKEKKPAKSSVVNWWMVRFQTLLQQWWSIGMSDAVP